MVLSMPGLIVPRVGQWVNKTAIVHRSMEKAVRVWKDQVARPARALCVRAYNADDLCATPLWFSHAAIDLNGSQNCERPSVNSASWERVDGAPTHKLFIDDHLEDTRHCFACFSQ
jgi:hypothetical protein